MHCIYNICVYFIIEFEVKYQDTCIGLERFINKNKQIQKQ